MALFSDMIVTLTRLEFFDFVLPWLLAFVIVYGILIKAKIFEEQKGVNGVLSIVIAFFLTAFWGVPLGQFFTGLFGTGVIILAGILVFLLFIGLMGIDVKTITKGKIAWIWILAFAILAYVAFVGYGGTVAGAVLTSESAAVIFMIVVLLMAVGFVTAEEESK
ncbi:MAG: hypothetical protein ACTSPB_04625 [Candidatus Thorarchaeota archaeon]